jgi:hypothetical protein
MDVDMQMNLAGDGKAMLATAEELRQGLRVFAHGGILTGGRAPVYEWVKKGVHTFQLRDFCAISVTFEHFVGGEALLA